MIAVVSYFAWRQSVPRVRAELRPVPKLLGVKTPLAVDLKAARGGVASVEVRVVQGTVNAVVAQQAFAAPPAAEQHLDLAVAGRDLGLRDGPATIEVRARDGFWRPFRPGDQPILSVPVTIKFTPPTLEVLGATHYLHQGGGGLAALRAKGASRAGVKVGADFFPAYPVGPADGGLAVALFALPWNLPDATPIAAWAEDEAGNAVSRPLPSELKPRRFPSGTVDISDKFLAAKLPELLPERSSIPPDQQVPAFLVINRDQRKQAEETKRQIAANAAAPLWEGAFVQPRNTKVFSNFAETRTYRLPGQGVDTQVHLGFDLASPSSPGPAANAGRWPSPAAHDLRQRRDRRPRPRPADALRHLSSHRREVGDAVTKGQELGR